jgi:dihydroorotase
MFVIDAVCATSEKVERQQILVNPQTGLIEEVGKLGYQQADYVFRDEEILFAGMGDIHIHGREDVSQLHLYKEDYFSVSEASLQGGVTCVCDMPNNPVPPVDDQSYKAKLQLTRRGFIPIFLYAGVGPATRPLSLKVPYKVYMGPSIGELYFKNEAELDETLQHYRGQWVSFHCEDPELLEKHKTQRTHLERRPAECEVMATAQALRFIEKYDLKGKLCHYSAGEGLPLILESKKRGVSVKAEVTPQHLYFNDEMISLRADYKHFQMNPPIRGKKDQEALLHAAYTGEIDFLATDHAPHSPEEKARGTSGLTGLDTYGAFVTWLHLEQKFSLQRLAAFTAEKPGDFLNEFLPELTPFHPYFKLFPRGWGSGFGYLKPHFMANFTILNLKKPKTFSMTDLKTKAQHSPFLGVSFPGSVAHVFIAGKKYL